LSPAQATTIVAAVVGHPVRHSLSPALHNAAFAARGLDWTFVAFDIGPGQGAAAVQAARALGLGGLSVTMPLKAEVAQAVDELDPVARRLGAVNTVVPAGDRLVGYSTDGAGFLDSLSAEGIGVVGRRSVVLGAGGAARAVILALGEAGASEVAVVNRTESRGRGAAALAGPAGRLGRVEDVASADLVVNATPVGMDGTAGAGTSLAGVVEHLRGAGQVVVDLVYHPRRTPLLEAAERHGAATVDGLGMLVHQAGRAFSLWTGDPAPIAAMRDAAEIVLSR